MENSVQMQKHTQINIFTYMRYTRRCVFVPHLPGTCHTNRHNWQKFIWILLELKIFTLLLVYILSVSYIFILSLHTNKYTNVHTPHLSLNHPSSLHWPPPKTAKSIAIKTGSSCSLSGSTQSVKKVIKLANIHVHNGKCK